MAKTANKTMWTVALIGVLVFLVWKLWPSIRKALNQSVSGAGAGGAVGGNQQGYYPPPSSQPQSGLNIKFPDFGGGGSGSRSRSTGSDSSAGGGITPFLANLLGGQDPNADNPVFDTTFDNAAVDGITLQSDPNAGLLTLDDLPTTSVDDGSGDGGSGFGDGAGYYGGIVDDGSGLGDYGLLTNPGSYDYTPDNFYDGGDGGGDGSSYDGGDSGGGSGFQDAGGDGGD